MNQGYLAPEPTLLRLLGLARVSRPPPQAAQAVDSGPWSLQTGLSGRPGLAPPPARTWQGGLGGSRVFPAAAVSLTRISASRKYRSFVPPDLPARSVCSALAPHDSSPLPVLGPRGWAGRESRWGEGRGQTEILDHNFRLFFCQWHLLFCFPPWSFYISEKRPQK